MSIPFALAILTAEFQVFAVSFQDPQAMQFAPSNVVLQH